MRKLNLDEFEDKLLEYSSDVEYIDKMQLNIKFTQFWNFINSQPIGKNVLERIENDYKELGLEIEKISDITSYNRTKEIQKLINTPDKQGAFAYFKFKEISIKEYNNFATPQLNLADSWYNTRGEYDTMQEIFNSHFLIPFTKLIEWYIYESRSTNPLDYYSKEEIEEKDKKFDEIISRLDELDKAVYADTYLVSNQLDEVMEYIQSLPRGGFDQLMKGKLIDLFIKKTLNPATIQLIWNTLFPSTPFPFN